MTTPKRHAPTHAIVTEPTREEMRRQISLDVQAAFAEQKRVLVPSLVICVALIALMNAVTVLLA